MKICILLGGVSYLRGGGLEPFYQLWTLNEFIYFMGYILVGGCKGSNSSNVVHINPLHGLQLVVENMLIWLFLLICGPRHCLAQHNWEVRREQRCRL